MIMNIRMVIISYAIELCARAGGADVRKDPGSRVAWHHGRLAFHPVPHPVRNRRPARGAFADCVRQLKVESCNQPTVTTTTVTAHIMINSSQVHIEVHIRIEEKLRLRVAMVTHRRVPSALRIPRRPVGRRADAHQSYTGVTSISTTYVCFRDSKTTNMMC